MTPAAGYFTPRLFEFLRELKRNNRKEWFEANRARYERDVREPFLRFITDFAGPLKAISKSFIADPRPQGGSLFRLHRDTRFAADKSPYKTHAGAQFRHLFAKDVHAPGFYLHLEPGEPFGGGGLWHPEGSILARVRDAIVAHPKKWTKVVRDPGFIARFNELGGESLKRPPQGYDPNHPLIEDLKRKDFVFGESYTEQQVCGRDFLDRYVECCRTAAGLMRFLTEALELPW